MELVYRPSESTVRPVEVEKSKHTVFLRKDIVEEDRDGMTFYTYQEAKLSHADFAEYSSFIVAKNAINGVNDSANINNLLDGQAIGDNNQLIIMEALADLYDVIASVM